MLLAFARLSLGGYLLYGFGYLVPLLRRDLGLSESIAGLHASAIAVGIILSGVAGERFVRRLGPEVAARTAILGMGAACLAVAFAPHPAVSLSGGLVFGFFAGAVLSWVNQGLSALGGHAANVALARANLLALIATLFAPLAIAAFDDWGIGGRLGLLVPLPLIGLLEVVNWRRPMGAPGAPNVVAAAPNAVAAAPEARTGREPSHRGTRLPAAYWRAWVVLVLVVSLEFAVVFWGSTLVATQTGAGTALATTAAAAFVVGMVLGRGIVATGIGRRTTRTRLMTVALIVVVVGIGGAWQATSVALSAGSLFLAGLGVGPLYPVGVAFSLSLASSAPDAAAARTTLASGVAILSAPFILAVAAERVGLVSAWPLLAVIALAAIGMLVVTRRDARAV